MSLAPNISVQEKSLIRPHHFSPATIHYGFGALVIYRITCYNAGMLTKKQKVNLINKNKKHDSDTGSSAVQVALLTKRIEELTGHLKKHRKDNHSRKGLLQLVAKRRSHEKYLEKKRTK